jgi:hypothetical protein
MIENVEDQWAVKSLLVEIKKQMPEIMATGMLRLPRYIKVKVKHYLLFMFSPPKISWVVSGIKYICLHLIPVFYI